MTAETASAAESALTSVLRAIAEARESGLRWLAGPLDSPSYPDLPDLAEEVADGLEGRGYRVSRDHPCSGRAGRIALVTW